MDELRSSASALPYFTKTTGTLFQPHLAGPRNSSMLYECNTFHPIKNKSAAKSLFGSDRILREINDRHTRR